MRCTIVKMKRRTFVGLLGTIPLTLRAAADPMDRIGVSTWSLHTRFQATRGKDVPDSDLIKLLDFFGIVNKRWGVRHFECVNMHFESQEPQYLAAVRKAVEAVRGTIQNIPCDIRGTNLSDDDEAGRQRSVAAVKTWIDSAVAVGSPSIRCNTGRSKDPANIEPAVRSYRELSEYGAGKKVRVIIENHGGISSRAEAIMKLIRAVNHPNLGTLPDFGNFPTDEERYPGLELMFPLGRICHAKIGRTNQQGEWVSLDVNRCVQIAERTGFKGVYSVEYEGPGDPYEGVTQSIAILKKALG